jgi:hypothetical protein
MLARNSLAEMGFFYGPGIGPGFTPESLVSVAALAAVSLPPRKGGITEINARLHRLGGGGATGRDCLSIESRGFIISVFQRQFN